MDRTIKILLVDDDEDDYIITRNIVKNISRNLYQIEWVPDYDRAVELILKRSHDVYLIDYWLGTKNGLDLIRQVIKSGCQAPFILLTGEEDIETDEQATKAGASDYLLKGKLTAKELERSIRYSIQNSKNIEEIQKLNLDLEERVRIRTTELVRAFKDLKAINEKQKQSEAEVRKALEKEKELNEMKSRFVTIASHEFRTPLTAVLSSASLVMKYSEVGNNQKVCQHVNYIKTSVKNLTEILNEFLSLSKLEEGAIGSKPSRFNLKDLVIELKEELASVMKEGQYFFYEHRGEDLVFLDKQIVRNILLNLISNAIKYSIEGAIEILTTVNDSAINISVRDEGIGIPVEDQPFLFSRFFRANNVINIQGTGLGLNIVKKYADLINANISFESEQGKGTVFKLEIPLNN